MASIGGQVHEDLAQVTVIHTDSIQVARQPGFDGDSTRQQLLEHLFGIMDLNVEVERLGSRFRIACERENIPNKIPPAFAGLQDLGGF